MDFSPRLGLPYIAAQQAQKQVTYNEAIKALDLLVQPVVQSRTLTTPPAGPAEGDAYIVADSAGGAWGGKDATIAVFIDGAWSFRTPAAGWLAWVLASSELAIFDGSGWSAVVSNGGSTVATFGVNTSADTTNRLAVAADASLFTHDGAGHRLKVGKASTGNTASLVFQDGASGRAELGLCGDDDFHVKVSADGSGWTEALTVAHASGLVTLPAGQLGFPGTQNASAGANVLDDYEEGAFTPAISFGGASTGITYGGDTWGRYTKVGRLVSVSGLVLLTAKGSSTGEARITGLPFTSIGGSNRHQSGTVGRLSGLSSLSGAPGLDVESNSTFMRLCMTGAGTLSLIDNSNFSNSSFIFFAATYEAA